MEILVGILLILVGYLLGSIPSGVLIVRLATGKDVRKVESGRTGGTNAMRAAGIWAGLATGVLDTLKAAVSVWLAGGVFQAIFPGSDLAIWVRILAPVGAILGHNYSIFLIERNEKGQLRLRGGAGGAPSLGGAMGFWWPVVFLVLPIGLAVFYFIGYASLTTISIALVVIVTFTIRAIILPDSAWQYVLYGVIAELLLIWALRPNIKRLIQGNERLVGWRARQQKKAADATKAP
jgi:acyl phosphate:glycerol-3-phosphate acyltransferase